MLKTFFPSLNSLIMSCSKIWAEVGNDLNASA